MTQNQKLLAVSLSDIGDLIQITPALNAIRVSLPQAAIHVLTTRHAAPILTSSGLTDQVITFDKFAFDSPRNLLNPKNWQPLRDFMRSLRAERYDTVILFHQFTTRFGVLKWAVLAYAVGAPVRAGLDNGRGFFLTHRAPDLGFGAKHQADYWLDVAATIGANPAQGGRIRVGTSDADRAWAASQVPHSSIIIHPGSGGFTAARRWEADKFARVAERLHRENSTENSSTENSENEIHPAIVIVGGANDGADAVINALQVAPQHTTNIINMTGKTTLNQLAAVIARGSVYLGADSGVMHIAATTETPLHAVFGPSNAYAWQPRSDHAAVYRSGSLCSPCSYIGRTVGLRHGCTARTCMKMLHPEDIVNPSGTTDPGYPARWRDPALHLLGVPVDSLTFEAQLDQIARWVTAFHADQDLGRHPLPHQICSVNPEYIIAAQRDVLLFTILKRASMTAPDGVGVLWAARMQGLRLPERVTGSDGLPRIAGYAAKHGWKLYILGAGTGVADLAAQKLCQANPGLQIVGTYAGTPAADEEDAIAARVAASGADILFVAYGGREQEHWIARNLPRLNVAVAIGVGGAVDFVAGITERAPVWMRRAGIEWLHRLIKQPWRWRRMLRLPSFVLMVLWRGEKPPRAFSGGQP